MRRIAIYGKGGIGKSTIAAHVAAAWAQSGLDVLLIGCDPKADSTRALLGRRTLPLLDRYEELLGRSDRGGGPIALDELIEVGFARVRCVEIGGPEPGIGCAGRGISMALELMDKNKAFNGMDVVVFDVLGDIVCGGFATPMRLGYAREVYIVTSGEFSALYAANNIARGMHSQQVDLGGIIANCRAVPGEVGLVTSFAEAIGSRLIGIVPRSSRFPRSELLRKTVMQMNPQGEEARFIHSLSQAILQNDCLEVPNPLSDDALDDFAEKCYLLSEEHA